MGVACLENFRRLVHSCTVARAIESNLLDDAGRASLQKVDIGHGLAITCRTSVHTRHFLNGQLHGKAKLYGGAKK